MPEPVDLAYALRLPPREAIAYFRAKGYAISWNWWDVWQEAHTRAFTVAKAVRADVLETLREEVDRALAEGITAREFRRNLEPRLRALGWWGRQIFVDSQGGAELAQLGSPWRLNTIYRVNLQTAYMTGRYKAQAENAQARPYWQYVAVLDAHTRPSHAALHGKVFRFDDPFWETFYPPNGWNCRCRVRALAERQLQAMGLTAESSAGKIGEQQVKAGLDKRTGEEIWQPVASYSGLNQAGQPFTFLPDVGWSYNPGRAAWQPELRRWAGDIAAQYLRAQRERGSES